MDLEAVKNLAGLLEGDVIRAAEAYSRALTGQFDMFREMGIVIDNNLEQHEKLAALQEEVARRGAGQLEAANQTLEGSFQQLGNVTGDALEGLGNLLAQFFETKQGVVLLTDTLQFYSNLLPQVTDSQTRFEAALPKTAAAIAENTRELNEARAAAEGYRREALQGITEDARDAEAALNETTAAIREQKRRQDEIANATLARDLSAVDLAEERGELSPREAQERRFALRQGAEDTEAARAEAARQQIRQAVEARAGEAAGTAAQGEESAQSLRERIAEQEARIADLNMRFTEIRAARRNAEENRAEADRGDNPSNNRETRERARRERDFFNNQVEAMRELFDENSAALENAKGELERLKVELTTQEQLVEAQREAAEAANANLEQLVRAQEAVAAQQARLKALEDERRRIEQQIATGPASVDGSGLADSADRAAGAVEFAGRDQRFEENSRQARERQAAERQLAQNVRAAADALRDGTTADELQALSAAMLELAQAAQQSDARAQASIEAVRGQIAELRSQIADSYR